MATAVPDIGPLVSLIGSVGFSSLGLMMPVVMETVWYWYPKDDDGDGGGKPCRDAENRGTIFAVNGVQDNVSQQQNAEKRMPPTGIATTVSRRRLVRRAIRHVKNALLFVLAVFALIGGAYYNVRDIAALQAANDGGVALESPAE